MIPKIPYILQKNKSQIVQFRGINYSDMLSDGDMSDSSGISLRRYPYLANKKGREVMGQIKDREIKAFTVYGGKLLCIDDESNIYYDGQRIGDCFTATPQLVTVGNKVVIFPDKSYVDFSGETPVVKKLESELSGNAVFKASSVNFEGRAATPYVVAGVTIGQKDDETRNYILKAGKRNVLRNYEGDNYLCVLKVTNTNGEVETRLYRAKMYDIKTWFEDGVLCAHADGFPFKKGDAAIVYDVLTEDCRSLEIVSLDDGGNDAYGKKCYKIDFGTHDWKHTQSGYILLGKSYGDFGESRKIALEITRYGYNTRERVYGETAYVSKENGGDNICRFTKAEVPGNAELAAGIFHGKIASAGMRTKFSSYLEKGRGVKLKVDNTTYTCEVVKASEYSFDFKLTEGSAPPPVNPDWITITAAEAEGLDQYFRVGDCVEISGSNSNNTFFVIDKIVGQELFAASEIFNATNQAELVTVARRVPDLDFICENHNRLFGCSNKDRMIYVSALGDPTNMYTNEVVSTDSFAVPVAGEGEFTACVRHDTSVLFFKEDKIYKLAGSYPAEFALYSYEVAGVQSGSDKSCTLINEVLFYKGVRGIYAYDGSLPTLISDRLGDRRFYNACAGNDGASYYVSMNDDPDIEKGSWYLFSYDTQRGIWMLEENGTHAVSAARIGGELCLLLNDGIIYRENASTDFKDSKWLVRFAPIYEAVDGKRTYSRILVRISLPQNSYITIKIRCDGDVWQTVGQIVGKTEAVIPIRIPINRCDKFELELSGKGECTIHDIMREYHVSEV